MTSEGVQRDVIFLVADRNIEAAVRGLLGRARSLSIRRVNCDMYTHSGRDPGCYGKAHDFLRPFHKRYAHAIVVFDREGCGNDTASPLELQVEVEARLARNGWGDRARVVVPDPELEAWVWSDSPHVPTLLGWKETAAALRAWLVERSFLEQGHIKPQRPKEAMEAVLYSVRKPRSSSIYQKLAGKVSLKRCVDPAFGKLQVTLQEWFPAQPQPPHRE